MVHRCLLVGLAVLLTACAGGAATAEDALASGQRSLDERVAGRLDFVYRASAGDTGPVGFEIEGPYSFERGKDLAVLDLTYRLLLGDDVEETRVVSTGERAWVVADDEATRLTREQVRPLRLGSDRDSPAVPAVDLTAWVRDGKVTKKGDRTTITGRARASAVIDDLQRLAAQVAGVSGEEIGEADAERIDEALRSSLVTVVTKGDDHVLRSLRARLDFGSSTPSSLRAALGEYAAAKLELRLQVDDVETPLRVSPPT